MLQSPLIVTFLRDHDTMPEPHRKKGRPARSPKHFRKPSSPRGTLRQRLNRLICWLLAALADILLKLTAWLAEKRILNTTGIVYMHRYAKRLNDIVMRRLRRQ